MAVKRKAAPRKKNGSFAGGGKAAYLDELRRAYNDNATPPNKKSELLRMMGELEAGLFKKNKAGEFEDLCRRIIVGITTDQLKIAESLVAAELEARR